MIRGLTAGERALAWSVFGDALEPETVRLATLPPPLRRAFVAGRAFGREWILWPRAGLPADFAEAGPGLQAVFVHELVHVWQAQQGVNLLLAKLAAGDRRDSYVYPLERCDWTGLNIEQQAMAVEHAFRLSRGGDAPAPGGFYRTVLPFAHCTAFTDLEPRRA